MLILLLILLLDSLSARWVLLLGSLADSLARFAPDSLDSLADSLPDSLARFALGSLGSVTGFSR